jgi:hypothetical protein
VKPFSRFILHRAGHLEQLDHSRNPFRVSSSYRAGRLEQLDHSQPFSHFIFQRAGLLEQLDHSQNSSRSFIIGQVAQNNLIHLKNQKIKKQKVGHRLNDLFLDFYISL